MFDNIEAYREYLKNHLYRIYPRFYGFIDQNSFDEDFNNLINLTRVLSRNKESINIPILVNRIIILNNVWGDEFIKCIPYFISHESGLIAFNTIAVFLGIMKPSKALRTDKALNAFLNRFYEGKRCVLQRQFLNPHLTHQPKTITEIKKQGGLKPYDYKFRTVVSSK